MLTHFRKLMYSTLFISIMLPGALWASDASSMDNVTKTQGLSGESIIELSEFFNANVFKGIRQTWQGENVQMWRQALYQTACTKRVPDIVGYPIYKTSKVAFQQAIKSYLPESGLPADIADTVIFNDMAATYYRSYVLIYGFGVTSGIMALVQEYPVQFEDICYGFVDEPSVKPDDLVKNFHKYQVGLDLTQLSKAARQQYDLLVQLGKISPLVFMRSTYPRLNILLPASMTRIFADHEDFKKVQLLYLNTGPLLAENGYISTFNEMAAEFDYSPISIEEDNWRIANHLWDMQRIAFYQGMDSVVRRLKAASPDAYQTLKGHVLSGMQTIIESSGIDSQLEMQPQQ